VSDPATKPPRLIRPVHKLKRLRPAFGKLLKTPTRRNVAILAVIILPIIAVSTLLIHANPGWPQPLTGLYDQSLMLTSPNGNIAVGSGYHDRYSQYGLLMFNADGTPSGNIGSTSDSMRIETVDKDGVIYGVDTNQYPNVAAHIGSSHRWSRPLLAPCNGASITLYPYNMVIGADGNLWLFSSGSCNSQNVFYFNSLRTSDGSVISQQSVGSTGSTIATRLTPYLGGFVGMSYNPYALHYYSYDGKEGPVVPIAETGDHINMAVNADGLVHIAFSNQKTVCIEHTCNSYYCLATLVSYGPTGRVSQGAPSGTDCREVNDMAARPQGGVVLTYLKQNMLAEWNAQGIYREIPLPSTDGSLLFDAKQYGLVPNVDAVTDVNGNLVISRRYVNTTGSSGYQYRLLDGNTYQDKQVVNTHELETKGFGEAPANAPPFALAPGQLYTALVKYGSTINDPAWLLKIGIPELGMDYPRGLVLAEPDKKPPEIGLEPVEATNPVGTMHNVIATIRANGNPVAGIHVTFTVADGPNASQASGLNGCSINADCVTDANGKAYWSYTSNGKTGTDTIRACFSDSVHKTHCADAKKSWVRDVVFVHGIGSSFRDVQDCESDDLRFQTLLCDPAIHKNVDYFPHYQDLGYRDKATGTCASDMPKANENTTPLVAHPESISPAICDSQAALAYSSTALDDELSKLQGPVAIINNSMGAAITRGWLAWAQDSSRPNSPNLQKVDTVLSLEGAQQGSWLGLGIRAEQTTDKAWEKLALNWAFGMAKSKFGWDVNRPAPADLTPQSDWYYKVNPKQVPASMHYYNFYGNIGFYVMAELDWGVFKLPKYYEVGDGVIMPGQSNPQAVPPLGGAQFLPAGPPADRNQYALNSKLANTVFLGDDFMGYFYDLFDTKAALSLKNDPVAHWNLSKHLDDQNLLVGSCGPGHDDVTIKHEILRLLTDPAKGCGN